jgi:transcriptional regulator with XRE-family HTH domain
MNLRSLARSLRAWRYKRNLTQRDAAEKLGMSQSSVSMFESGLRDLSEARAKRVAKMVGHRPKVGRLVRMVRL